MNVAIFDTKLKIYMFDKSNGKDYYEELEDSYPLNNNIIILPVSLEFILKKKKFI